MAIGYSTPIHGHWRYGLTGISAPIAGHYTYSPTWRVWMNAIRGRYRYINADTFPSMMAEYDEAGDLITPPATEDTETLEMFGVTVYLNGVDVPADDVRGVWVQWPLNGSILGGCTFRNWEGTYNDGTYPDNQNYIRIVFESRNGQIDFPVMIIQEQDGGWELNVQAVDGLSHILCNPVTLPGYVAREAMTRDSETSYHCHGITLGTASPAFRVLINLEESTGTYNNTSKILTVSPIIDEDIPVSLEAPYYAKWLLSDLLSQLRSANLIKTSFTFSDFLIYENIPVWKTPPIDIITQIVEAIPGEWYIEPFGNFFRLVIQKMEYTTPSTGAKFVLNEDLYKAPPAIKHTITKGYNTINVIRPAIREAAVYSWQDISDTSIEEVTVDFGGQYAVIDSIECIKVDETADGGTVEITEYLGTQNRGGISVCTGVLLEIVVNKEHEYNGETIDTPYSMIGYKVVWETYQGGRTPPADTIDEAYRGYAPLTDTEWNNYLDILKEGINAEVTTAPTDLAIIRADSNITNGFIPSLEAAIDIGRQNIRLANITQIISCSIIPAFGFNIIPGVWGIVQYGVWGINKMLKIKEIKFSCADQVFDLSFVEGVEAEV